MASSAFARSECTIELTNDGVMTDREAGWENIIEMSLTIVDAKLTALACVLEVVLAHQFQADGADKCEARGDRLVRKTRSGRMTRAGYASSDLQKRNLHLDAAANEIQTIFENAADIIRRRDARGSR
jgi:hypothetical protein